MYRDVEQSGQLSFVSIAHNYGYEGTYTKDQVMIKKYIAGWSSLVSSDGS